MDQINESQLYVCTMLNLASKHGEVFTIYYPRDWIDQDLENNCQKCKTLGSWQGYRIARCTEHCENGCGMIDVGVEYNVNSPNSATNTYLKGVNWEKELGDIDFGETHKQMQAVHPKPERREYNGEWYIIDRSQLPYTMTRESEYTCYVNPTIDSNCQKSSDPEESCDQEEEGHDESSQFIRVMHLKDGKESVLFDMPIDDDSHDEVEDELEDEIDMNGSFFQNTYNELIQQQYEYEKWIETKINEYDESQDYDEGTDCVQAQKDEKKNEKKDEKKDEKDQDCVFNKPYDCIVELLDDDQDSDQEPDQFYVPAISINQHRFRPELEQLQKDAARFRQYNR